MALKQQKEQSKFMIDGDKEYIKMCLGMEDMVNGVWEPPGEISDMDGYHKVVVSDPHDAMRALQRVLAKELPVFHIRPVAPNDETKLVTDEWEKGLMWLYKQASKRLVGGITEDLAWSAGLYGRTVGQVIYLPHEIQARQAFKGETARLERALNEYGPFIIQNYNPMDVHTIRSGHMIEAALKVRVMRIHEIENFWGEKAAGLVNKAKNLSDEEHKFKYAAEFDFTDSEVRSVWAVLLENDKGPIDPENTDAFTIINNEKHGLKFLNWWERISGTGMAGTLDKQAIPMLKTVWDTGAWETLNALETMAMSKTIRLYGRPGLVEEGPNPKAARINYDADTMGDILKAPPQNTVRSLVMEALDQGMLLQSDRVSARLDKSTISKLVLTGEFPANTAASAVNIITQSALASIEPYKRTTERGVEDIVTLQLRWIEQFGEPLTIFGAVNKKNAQITIKPEHINVKHIYVDAELQAAAPEDRVARVNAAQLELSMGLPKEEVYGKTLRKHNPREIIALERREQIEQTVHGGKIQEYLAGIELKIQELAQKLAQAQAGAGGGGEGNGLGSKTPDTGVGGDGFDTSLQGTSTVGALGATNEQQTGADRNQVPLQ